MRTVLPASGLALALLLLVSATWVGAGGAEKSGVSVLAEGLNHPVDVAVDGTGNVYFTLYAGEGEGALARVTPQGAFENMLSGLTTPTGLAVDGDGNIFFAETSSGLLKRLSPGAVAPVALAEGLRGGWGLALDREGGIFVAVRSVNGSIARIPPGGGQPTRVLEGLNVPMDIAVDEEGGLYFVEFGTNNVQNGTLKRLRPGESEPRTILERLWNPYAVAVGREGKVYFTEKTGDLKVLGGMGAEPVTLLSGLGRVYGLAAAGDGSLYFAVFGSPLGGGDGTINRLALEGQPPASIKRAASLGLEASPATLDLGGAFSISGLLTPPAPAVEVTLSLRAPNGTVLKYPASTDSQGSFKESFKPDAAGVWVGWAEWRGDEQRGSAVSRPFTVSVKSPQADGFTPLPQAPLLGVSLAIGLALGFIIGTRRRPAARPTPPKGRAGPPRGR